MTQPRIQNTFVLYYLNVGIFASGDNLSIKKKF